MFDMELITLHQLLDLSSVSSSIRASLKKRIENNAVFRIPPNCKVTTLSPRKVIVYTPSSIPSTTHHLVVSHFSHHHCNTILSSLSNHNLYLVELALEVCKAPNNAGCVSFTTYSLENTRVGQYFSPFTYCFNDIKWSSTITHLTTGNHFNQPLETLPSTLKHLTFGHSFNQPLDNLPTNLTHLTTGKYFNQTVDNLPSKLLYFYTSLAFNQSVDNLPSTLTHLLIEDNTPDIFHTINNAFKFNQPIDKLPSKLTHLSTGNQFNYPIDNLPQTITHLNLGCYFSKPIIALPPGLISLSIGYSLNHRINHVPSTLRHLEMSNIRNTLELPKNITHLFTDVANKHTICALTSLHHFTVGSYYGDELPPKITHLAIENIDHKLLYPDTLTHLSLGDPFNSPLDNLPPNLTHLVIGKLFKQELTALPQTLTHLTTGHSFNKPLNNLPPKLSHLTTSFKFNCSIDDLPSSLKHLTLGDCFNQSVDRLPPSLTQLTTGEQFNQPVNHLPQTLCYLYCTGKDFNQQIGHLPLSVTYVATGAGFNQPHRLPSTAIHIQASSVCPCTVKHHSFFAFKPLILVSHRVCHIDWLIYDSHSLGEFAVGGFSVDAGSSAYQQNGE